MEKECVICDKTFNIRPYRKDIAKCCSIRCKYKHLKTLKRSDEVKLRISLSSKGSKRPWSSDNGIKTRFKKGQIPHNKGIPMSEEQKRKVAMGKRQFPFIEDYMGYYRFKENNGKYILFHRMVMEYYLERELTSDEYIHHIDGNKKNNFIWNLELTNISEHTKKHWDQGDIRGGRRNVFNGGT